MAKEVRCQHLSLEAGFPVLALSEPTFDFLSRKGTGGGREEAPYQVPGRVGYFVIVTL